MRWKVASSVSASDWPPAKPPTVWAKTSTLPKRATTVSTSVWAPSRVEISAGNAVKFGLLKSDCCILRDVPTTVAPASRNACVTYVPKPPLAPVTSTTLPFIECSDLTGHQIPTGVKGYESRAKRKSESALGWVLKETLLLPHE